MNEPWLIGQTQLEGGKGNFEQGQFNQGQLNRRQFNQGQASGQSAGLNNGQIQGQAGATENENFQRGPGTGANRNFTGGFRREGMEQGSFMGIIRGLHEGRVGNMNIKWLIDIVAVAMIILTGTGIYLSIKVLGAEAKRKKRQAESF